MHTGLVFSAEKRQFVAYGAREAGTAQGGGLMPPAGVLSGLGIALSFSPALRSA
jgi:hypothetical protein